MGMLAPVTTSLVMKTPSGLTTTVAHDAADRLVTETRPDGAATTFAHDASGNVVKVVPPGRPGHDFSYTAIDDPSAYTAPMVGTDATTTTYASDADGALTKTT